jgi:hypothetical protein
MKSKLAQLTKIKSKWPSAETLYTMHIYTGAGLYYAIAAVDCALSNEFSPRSFIGLARHSDPWQMLLDNEPSGRSPVFFFVVFRRSKGSFTWFIAARIPMTATIAPGPTDTYATSRKKVRGRVLIVTPTKNGSSETAYSSKGFKERLVGQPLRVSVVRIKSQKSSRESEAANLLRHAITTLVHVKRAWVSTVDDSPMIKTTAGPNRWCPQILMEKATKANITIVDQKGYMQTHQLGLSGTILDSDVYENITAKLERIAPPSSRTKLLTSRNQR